MGIVGGQYVSNVAYTTQPISGTNDADLTSDTNNGISFPQPPTGSNGLLDNQNQPLYTILINFNQPGVDSLGSVTVKPKPNSNVNQFGVQFYVASSPNQPYTLSTGSANQPLYLKSSIGSQPSITSFPPEQVPSPLIGIRIIVLSTTDSL
jgi:hypothetical protein